MKKITHIACAVRGRPESRETVAAAIDLAIKHNARLTFIYILDAEFLHHATIGPLSVVYQELRQMSEFTMLILVDRALRRGIENAEFIIGEGNVQNQIREYIKEKNIDMLILGLPGLSHGRAFFTLSSFNQFIEELIKELGIHVHVVGRNEI